MAYALITGASKGIGKEIAAELAKRNYDLLLVARSESLLAEVAKELSTTYNVKADYLSVDLAAVDVAQQVIDWTTQKGYEVSILVNNAGYGLVGSFDSYSISQNRDMLNLNIATLTEMCHHFLPMLKRQPKAYIMNIASSTAYQALPLMAAYAASKIYVLNFSRGLKLELKKTSVSVTCISPGATSTNFNDRANLQEKARKAAEKVTMTPQDVAKQSVEAMFAGKAEFVPGLVNKLGKFLAWIAPKAITESVAMGIYE
jgi:short-subunit dehydrogenase